MPIADKTSLGLATARCFVQPAITSGIAAFSAAVSAGKRLYCWNTNPMFLARNRVSARSLIVVTSLPKMLTVPLSPLRMPAITDSKVVLPQPDGPTIRRHLTGVDVPVDPAQGLHALLATAEMLGQTTNPHRDRPRRFVVLGRRLRSSIVSSVELTWPSIDSLPRTERRINARDRDRHSQRKTIAGSSRITRCTLSRLDRMQIKTIAPAVTGSSHQGVKKASSVPADSPAEQGRQADADPVAEQSDHRGLQQDHADDPSVGHPHRLQGTELLDVLEGEVVEGLPGDRRAHQEAQEGGDAEIDRDSRIDQVILRSSSSHETVAARWLPGRSGS